MFNYHFSGTLHDCGEIELTSYAFFIRFHKKNPSNEELEKIRELGSKFSSLCRFYVTPAVSNYLDDSDDSDDSNDSDDLNINKHDPRCEACSTGYFIRYWFDSGVTLERFQLILNALRKMSDSHLYFSASSLEQINKAAENFFAEKTKEKEITPAWMLAKSMRV